LAIDFPDDHQVDNRLLVRALSAAATRASAKFRIGSVRGILTEQGRAAGVELVDGALRSDVVVVAAGSWSSLIAGLKLRSEAVVPVRGQMARVRGPAALLKRMVVGTAAFLVPRIDGQVIVGTTVEFAGFEKKVTANALSQILGGVVQLCPALADAPVEEIWSGLRPYAEGGLPIIGPGPLPGLFLATGHFRDGILLAPVTARLITELVLGQRLSVDIKPFHFSRLES